MSAARRRCDSCSLESNASGMTQHLRKSGHAGWTLVGTAQPSASPTLSLAFSSGPPPAPEQVADVPSLESIFGDFDAYQAEVRAGDSEALGKRRPKRPKRALQPEAEPVATGLAESEPVTVESSAYCDACSWRNPAGSREAVARHVTMTAHTVRVLRTESYAVVGFDAADDESRAKVEEIGSQAGTSLQDRRRQDRLRGPKRQRRLSAAEKRRREMIDIHREMSKGPVVNPDGRNVQVVARGGIL